MQIGGVIFEALRESQRQFPAGVDIAEKNICDGVAAFVTAIPGLKDCRDVVDPGHLDGAAGL